MDEWDDGAQDEFLKQIVQGQVIPEILRLAGMPPINVVLGWMNDKKFKEKYDLAKKLRAEIFHDEAVKIARETNKIEAAANKLAVDTLKWAAAIGDGESYGQKTKLDNLGDGIIIVSTGIVRPDDPAFDQEDFDATISRHRVQAKVPSEGTTLAPEKV